MNDGKEKRGSEGEECRREELLKKPEALRHLFALETSRCERDDEPEQKHDGAPGVEKPWDEEPRPGEHEGGCTFSRLPGLADDDEKESQKKAAGRCGNVAGELSGVPQENERKKGGDGKASEKGKPDERAPAEKMSRSEKKERSGKREAPQSAEKSGK